MAISLSTARYLAPASFLIDFAAQLYGLLSQPSMKDVNDANVSFFSPQPIFVAAFFFPQQLLQAAWLWRLWHARRRPPVSLPAPTGADADGQDDQDDQDDAAVAQMVNYAPYYAAGNFCLAAWVLFWNSGRLAAADALVAANALTQLYYVAARLGGPRAAGGLLTRVVAQAFAGLGVLDLVHNTAAAFAVGDPPPTLVRILTGLGFGALAAAAGDAVFGACLVYDLVALAVGQHAYGQPAWSNLLGLYAVATAGIAAVRHWRR